MLYQQNWEQNLCLFSLFFCEASNSGCPLSEKILSKFVCYLAFCWYLLFAIEIPSLSRWYSNAQQLVRNTLLMVCRGCVTNQPNPGLAGYPRDALWWFPQGLDLEECAFSKSKEGVWAWFKEFFLSKVIVPIKFDLFMQVYIIHCRLFFHRLFPPTNIFVL